MKCIIKKQSAEAKKTGAHPLAQFWEFKSYSTSLGEAEGEVFFGRSL